MSPHTKTTGGKEELNIVFMWKLFKCIVFHNSVLNGSQYLCVCTF